MFSRNTPVLCFVCLLSIISISARAQMGISLFNVLQPSHPRLILTQNRIAELRKIIKTDPTAAEYFKNLTEQGQSMLKQKPIEHVLIGPRLLDKSRKALDRITTLALLYRLDGDRKWADRAILEMRVAAAFNDWNPSHYLDTAEMTAALGFGYDWLYDAMTPKDRDAIRDALVNKGLSTALALYRKKTWWVKSPFNWNNVCNGGMIIGTLAIADDEPSLSEKILNYALTSIPRALSTYAPDGAWPEGPGYWEYATSYTLYTDFALRSALGNDFGISEKPGLRDTGYFPFALTSSTELSFNFADAGTGVNPRPWHYALAHLYNNPVYAYLAREVDKSRNASPFDLIWFDSRGKVSDLASIKKDFYFSRIQVATLRSSLTDPNAVFIGFKAGYNSANHAHLDLGSFVLDWNGVRWADDLGSDSYNIPGYFGSAKRWSYYRLSTAGHNTLLVNGKNQELKGKAPITRFVSSKGSAYAIADLTDAYSGSDVTSAMRGIELGDRRSRVLVQDEIQAKTPIDVVWAMHTSASIVIDPSGTSAILTNKDKKLYARLLSPDGARFSLEEISLDPPQRPLKNERKLLVHLTDKITSARIAVLFSTENNARSVIKPLDEWK